MARVKGPSITPARRLAGLELRGSIGNVTYDRNQYTQYARNRTIPIDPKTPPQLAARAKLAAATMAWHVLSDHERALWRSLARGKPVTGFNLFIRKQMLKP